MIGLQHNLAVRGRSLASCFALLKPRSLSTSVRSRRKLRFLVIDGYAPEGRDDLRDGGASTAGDLYEQMLQRSSPQYVETACDQVFPADPDFNPAHVDIASYDGVAYTGSSLTVYEGHKPEVAQQLAFAKDVFRSGVPQYGSCFALQIAAVVLGGVCVANPMHGREMFLSRKIQLTPSGIGHPMFGR